MRPIHFKQGVKPSFACLLVWIIVEYNKKTSIKLEMIICSHTINRSNRYFLQFIYSEFFTLFFSFFWPGIKSPICAVSGAQYLTPSGWIELRNADDLDVPFRLFRDEGRTFLQVRSQHTIILYTIDIDDWINKFVFVHTTTNEQWLGESDLRYKMQGRLVLVHIMCRDMTTVHRGDSFYGSDHSGSGNSRNWNFFPVARTSTKSNLLTRIPSICSLNVNHFQLELNLFMHNAHLWIFSVRRQFSTT